MAKDSARKSKQAKETPFDGGPTLHPVTRRVMKLLDDLGIANYATIKTDGTTTITFQVDDSEAHPEIIGSETATGTKQ